VVLDTTELLALAEADVEEEPLPVVDADKTMDDEADATAPEMVKGNENWKTAVLESRVIWRP
jgi:hypothetical protein